MIDHLLPALILFLILNLAVGIWRVARGPTAADRMLAAILFGSTAVAVFLLMAEWMDQPALRNVALLVVMLAAIVSLAFVGIEPEKEEQANDPGKF